jgi:hypothetical protein
LLSPYEALQESGGKRQHATKGCGKGPPAHRVESWRRQSSLIAGSKFVPSVKYIVNDGVIDGVGFDVDDGVEDGVKDGEGPIGDVSVWYDVFLLQVPTLWYH